MTYLKNHEPQAVARRARGRFRRRRAWTAGVNDVWAMDQHDKWGRFHLWLHGGLEIHSGSQLWLKIWKGNSNPRLITSYYLEAARRMKGAQNLSRLSHQTLLPTRALGAPLITQSDPGTENFGVANAQTFIRRTLDPSLGETLQHRWMRKTKNIKPEIMWSVLRNDWSPGFEAMLDEGVVRGWYDTEDELSV